MTDTEFRSAADAMVYLVSCAVNESSPDADRVKTMSLDQVLRVAKNHLLTAASATALEAVGIHDPAFTQEKAKAIRKMALMDAEMTALFEKLKEAGIWYMPLKGAVLKDFYPAYGMRQMADYDILIEPSGAADVRKIMEDQGFITRRFGAGIHDVYRKEPVCVFEIHKALFGPIYDEKTRKYYEDVKDRLLGSGCEKHFSPEDFYIYFIAHLYKHYSVRGAGLRSLVDIYVYLSKKALDMEYVTAELHKMGLSSFETAIRSLSFHVFRGQPVSSEEKEMLEYVLSSGAGGTMGHRVSNAMEKNGWNRFQYMWNRFSVPFRTKQISLKEYASVYYPFFDRHKVLLPFLPFYRVFRAWRGGRLVREVKAVLKRTKH